MHWMTEQSSTEDMPTIGRQNIELNELFGSTSVTVFARPNGLSLGDAPPNPEVIDDIPFGPTDSQAAAGPIAEAITGKGNLSCENDTALQIGVGDWFSGFTNIPVEVGVLNRRPIVSKMDRVTVAEADPDWPVILLSPETKLVFVSYEELVGHKLQADPVVAIAQPAEAA